MWYDATSAAGSLEADGLPGRGQDRLRAGAGREDQDLRLAVRLGLGASQKASKKQDNAWKFISWASGKEYEKLVGEQARLVQGAGRQARLDLREPASTCKAAARVRRADPGGDRGGRPEQPRACSRGPRSASSSSTSPSSPTSAPRSRRTSARRSPARRAVDDGAEQGPDSSPSDVAERYQSRRK